MLRLSQFIAEKRCQEVCSSQMKNSRVQRRVLGIKLKQLNLLFPAGKQIFRDLDTSKIGMIVYRLQAKLLPSFKVDSSQQLWLQWPKVMVELTNRFSNNNYSFSNSNCSNNLKRKKKFTSKRWLRKLRISQVTWNRKYWQAEKVMGEG